MRGSLLPFCFPADAFEEEEDGSLLRGCGVDLRSLFCDQKMNQLKIDLAPLLFEDPDLLDLSDLTPELAPALR